MTSLRVEQEWIISEQNATLRQQRARTVIAQMIRMGRRKAALSQRELAARTNMDQGTICRLERGKQSTSSECIFALMDALGYYVVFEKK